MVHLPHLGTKLRREVKEEAVEADAVAAAAAEAAPLLHKRSRLAHHQHKQQWSASGASISSQQSSQQDFLDEPSPLGLRLKKSPSLVDLIQMKLAQANKPKDACQASNTGASEKLKASNFPGSVLRIGTWEWVSRYEGDLVAKCYFAKHKLVWEVLDGGLKSKIEIQWSDICGLKMFCPENEPGTLEIALSRQPLFFRETNPQPRKHTLWQATSDFTGGQASVHRRHFLQCPPGMMNKHVEKLVHCDPRLYSLSQQTDISLENPYFESKSSIFEDLEDIKCQQIEHNDDDQIGPQRYNAPLSPHPAAGNIDGEARQQVGTSDVLPGHFPCSASSTHMIKQDAASVECEPQASIFNWNGFRVPGIRRSMSKSEIANHIGHHMYRQIYSGNLPASGDDTSARGKLTLDELTGYLLGDTQIKDTGNVSTSKLAFDELTRQLLNDGQITDAADERMLMSRVNSLCSLIQRDAGLSPANPGVCAASEIHERKPQSNAPSVRGDGGKASLPPRQESFGDLLTNLPRISSFPHFL
ncbi:hypothetical protein ACP70R_047017 [Stipagrostis hirtigluma subsp. patula]